MKKLTFLFLIILLPLMACAQSQSQDNLVDRVSRAVGVRLPDGYEAKVKEFVTKNEFIKRKSAEAYTEKWIVGQMKTSWGIDKGDQLLFVWDAVYEQITKKNLYDGEDGNKKRLDEFEKVMDKVEACGKKFKEDFFAYMDQGLIILGIYGLKQCINFYQIRESAKPDQIAQFKNYAKVCTQDCKKYNIDYHSLLPLEVQKYYDIESSENKYNHATCGQAQVQIMKIVLREIVKQYNIFQHAPQATFEKDGKNASYFKECKELGIDYKAELRKELGDDKKVAELLKFYGVE